MLFILMWSIYYQTKLSDSSAFAGDMYTVYLFGMPATFLIFGALYLSTTVPRLFVYLGDASYSIYLVHGTVLSILIKIVIKLNIAAFFGSFTGAIILFIATLLISCYFYSAVEKKLLNFLNSTFVPLGIQK